MIIKHDNLQKVLGLELFETQREIALDNSRFKVLNAGRRFGKSILGAYIGTYEVLQPNKRIWIVAPTNSLTEKIWREVYAWFTIKLRPFVKDIYNSRGNFKLTTIHNSFIECKSTDDPTGLLGEGLDLLIADEASRIKEIAMKESLRPTLTDRQGKGVFISTPKGNKNWYYKDYMKGVKRIDGYKSWNLATNKNPYFPKEEWQHLINEFGVESPVFRQEYLAEFIDDVGAVFRNIKNNIKGSFEEPEKDVIYSMGVDLAKTSDYTVCSVIRNDNRQIVAFDRYNQIPYDAQIERIISLSARYNNANILIDSTGVGDPVFDMLRSRGANVTPFKFTNVSKENLIRNLMIALENGEVTYPEIDALIYELEIFEYTQKEAGTMRYSAPEGEHDDCVISLALAVKAVEGNHSGIIDFYKKENNNNEIKPIIQNYKQFIF